ncbi:MAG: phosphate uptake regulator PhoU [Marinilabiliaceae bacterium]|nr:phosphate uptake regulator PhoU [Marinilabiliaceae bacterium]
MLKKELAIQEIDEDFKTYSNLILKQLDLLERVLESGSDTVVDEVLKKLGKREDKVDRFEVKISEKIINVIVLYHPMASELRKLMACYRIIISLERIGDLILNVVKFVRKMERTELFAQMSDIIYNMLVSSSTMVQKALLSYINGDIDFAIWTIRNDDIVDEMNKKLMKKGIHKSKLSEEEREALMNLINLKSIISTIERIADHAGHIAEASVFSVEGTDIRHRSIDDDNSFAGS